MKVVLVSAVYPPEPVVSARMTADLARALADQGHEVTVCCPQPSRPMGTDYTALQAPKAIVRNEQRVTVVRLPSYAAPEFGFLKRGRESLSLGWHAFRYLASTAGQPDLLYVNSWPLLGQAAMAQYSRRSGARLILHVQDLYPESMLLKLPKVLRLPVHALLRGLDLWTARAAERVVTISEPMRQIYVDDRGLAASRVVTIHNWQDEQLFAQLPPRSGACARFGIPENRFTFLYAGNIGPVAGVDLLIRAFCEAQLPDAQLVVVGGGSAKADCEALAQRLGGENIRFVADPDAGNIPLLQSMAHVCLLPVKRGAALSSIPSKLVAYLFSAKPVLTTADRESDTAKAVTEAGCGWVEQPEDSRQLAVALEKVAAWSAEQLIDMGKRGRAYGLARYSKAAGVSRLSALFTPLSYANSNQDH
jgi:glycosyltransferase involved in cell wall biosynthesis